MRLRSLLPVAVAWITVGCACALTTQTDAPLGEPIATFLETGVHLATPAQAGPVLAASDDYTRAHGDYERALRMRSTEPVSEADFLEDAGRSARDWEPEARELWTNAVQVIAEAMRGLQLDLPAEILLIRTRPDYESGLPHTRGNAVVLPDPTDGNAIRLLAHEFFHIASRHDPGLRDRLFPIFGFETVDPVAVPEAFATRRLTNPDAVHFHHAVTVTTPDGPAQVVAMLSSNTPLEEAVKADSLIQVAELNLVTVDGARIYALADTDFGQVASINTGYIIHPEEVVADNFAMMCLRRAGLEVEIAQPAYVDRLEAELTR